MFSGKQLDCRPACSAVDLKQMCSSLRHRTQSAVHADVIPDSAFDLLHRLLDLNPFSRVTATDALTHPFIAHAEWSDAVLFICIVMHVVALSLVGRSCRCIVASMLNRSNRRLVQMSDLVCHIVLHELQKSQWTEELTPIHHVRVNAYWMLVYKAICYAVTCFKFCNMPILGNLWPYCCA